MIKTKVTSIEPSFDSPYPLHAVNVLFEKTFTREGVKFCNRASVSVMVEKKNQTLEELRSDAIAAAVQFLSELTEGH